MSQESFKLAYREIGIRLCIPGISDDNADVQRLVKETLSSGNIGDWLMVVDNADDSQVLVGVDNESDGLARPIDYIPHSNKGAVLFTTRSRKAAIDLTQSNVLEVNDMGKIEARQLLARRTTKQELLNDEAAVDILLETLTSLPLAIVQAAAFMSQNNTSVSEYLSLLQSASTKSELFREQFQDPSTYRSMHSTIAKTWHISFEQIQRQDPLAAEYLSFIACIDRVGIPQSILPPEKFIIQQVKALGTLTGYAFITERQQTVPGSGERFFDMHRLVHMALGWWLEGHGKQADWADTAAARVEELVPDLWHEGREVWGAYLPHAKHVAELVKIMDGARSASILERLGRCQMSLGQYASAITSHREASSLRKEILGLEHPDTLTSMSNLVSVLSKQGKYEEAERINRQELECTKRVLGPEHPDTLTSISHLALILDRQGKHEEAEIMNRQTLAQREKVLGPEHLSTLTSMSNLAGVLNIQRKYYEAEAMNRQTLARYIKVLGSEHPFTLTSMSNLALVLDSQNKYKEAEIMNRQTLALREKVLGPEHPDTLTSMNNLAGVLERQSKYKEAEVIHRQTLEQREKILGSRHPDTLTSMGILVGVLCRQGKYEEAEAISWQTLAQREEVLGSEHPDTLTSVYGLAQILAQRHRVEESLQLYQRASAGYDAVLGEGHPKALACRRRYADLRASQEQQLNYAPSTLQSGAGETTKKTSKLSRGLAKIGIRGSKH
ncbi:HET multi-domain protein [Curvularia clavata]|uniref:HET multi-domain protein n=1 Tax=Curvularia clavata TaxID=95742 RepID=A0A9Q9DYA7_CURCL|nr:HET multi-domain protein [Curvularia clavata]